VTGSCNFQVKWSSYKTYLKTAGPLLIILMALAIVENIFDHLIKFWLSDWGSDNSISDLDVSPQGNASETHEQQQYRLKVYGSLGLIRSK
jgi:hypothetical protein